MERKTINRVIVTVFLVLSIMLQLNGCANESEHVDNSENAGLTTSEGNNQDANLPNDKTTITIVSVSQINQSLQEAILKFNRSSSEYNAELIDYTNNGELGLEDAVKKLNLDLTVGNFPDIMCFASLSPRPYISKGVLKDMTEFIEDDGDINRSDIAIFDALAQNGKLYYTTDNFAVETTIAKYSRFGNRYGWTYEEYLDLEKEGIQMLYNISKESFLRRAMYNYMNTAIDWESATCNFNTEEFIEILNIANSIKEDKEDRRNMDFTLGAVRVAQDSLIASATYVTSVQTLSIEEQTAGEQLSYIGWPSIDASCGSNVMLMTPIGICANSDSLDGAWAFVKYFMLNASSSGLPITWSAIDELIKIGINNTSSEDPHMPISFSEEDGKRFRGLISSIKGSAFEEDPIIKIVLEEAYSLFNDNKSAENVASAINSKISIYLAEQS